MMACGEQCAVTIGVKWMQVSCADNLAFLVQVIKPRLGR